MNKIVWTWPLTFSNKWIIRHCKVITCLFFWNKVTLMKFPYKLHSINFIKFRILKPIVLCKAYRKDVYKMKSLKASMCSWRLSTSSYPSGQIILSGLQIGQDSFWHMRQCRIYCRLWKQQAAPNFIRHFFSVHSSMWTSKSW